MAFGYKRVSFNKVSSASGSTNVIPTTFQVKAAICWSIDDTTSDAFVATYSHSFGFSNGTTHRCVCENGVDNAAVMDNDLGYRSNVIAFVTSAGAIRAAATVAFGGSTDATFTWAVNDTSTPVIHCILLGDSDLTNAAVVDVVNPSGTGNFNVTTVGFQGDFMIGFSPTVITAASPTLSTAANGFGVGAAVSSSQQRTCCYSSENGGTAADTYNQVNLTTNRVVQSMNATTGAGHTNLGFVAWLSNGFTLSANTTQVVNGRSSFLVLKGGKYQVGGITGVVAGTPPVDATAVVTQWSGVDFKPAGVLFWGNRTPEGTTQNGVANAKFSIGAPEDAANETCENWADDDGVGNAVLASVQRTNRVAETMAPNATHGSSTVTSFV